MKLRVLHNLSDMEIDTDIYVQGALVRNGDRIFKNHHKFVYYGIYKMSRFGTTFGFVIMIRNIGHADSACASFIGKMAPNI